MDFVVIVLFLAATVFDPVVFAVVTVVVFRLFVAVVVLFVVAAVVSDIEIDDDDSAVAWGFFEFCADYFGDLDDVFESAVCWLHLGVLVDLAGFFKVY